MATEKQIAANRANALKSTGPRSRVGRQNSAKNSTRHGLFARPVLPNEQADPEFRDMLARLTDEFASPSSSNPSGSKVDPMDARLIRAMAIARWQQRRLMAIETKQLSHDLPADPMNATSQTLVSAAIFMGEICRQDCRWDRQYNRAFDTLLKRREMKNKQTNPIWARLESAVSELNSFPIVDSKQPTDQKTEQKQEMSERTQFSAENVADRQLPHHANQVSEKLENEQTNPILTPIQRLRKAHRACAIANRKPPVPNKIRVRVSRAPATPGAAALLR